MGIITGAHMGLDLRCVYLESSVSLVAGLVCRQNCQFDIFIGVLKWQEIECAQMKKRFCGALYSSGFSLFVLFGFSFKDFLESSFAVFSR